MKMRRGSAIQLLWIGTLSLYLLAVMASSQKQWKNSELKRQQLGFRPLHFATVGLPLGDTASDGAGFKNKFGVFKIDDGGVVGVGTYEIEPDGVDIGLSMKIETNVQGKPGARAGSGPTTPMPTTPVGGATGASTATTVPSGGTAGITPSQGPGGSATQPATGGLASTTSPTTGGGGGSASEQAGLNKHNEYRKVHGVPLMKLNAEMSRQAAAYAQKIANQGALQHASREERKGDGENLSYGCDADGQTTAEATTNWYNEVCDPGYTFGQGTGSPGTGHFTQVVWKKSVELGIGKADIDKDGMRCTYIVGRYRPAGNYIGDYAQNVPKGSFNKAQACAGIRKATILNYLAPRSIHKKKTPRKTHHY